MTEVILRLVTGSQFVGRDEFGCPVYSQLYERLQYSTDGGMTWQWPQKAWAGQCESENDWLRARAQSQEGEQ